MQDDMETLWVQNLIAFLMICFCDVLHIVARNFRLEGGNSLNVCLILIYLQVAITVS